MAHRWRRWGIAGAILLLLVLAAAQEWTIPGDWVASRASAATGRDVSLEHLSIRAWPLRIRARRLRIANPAGTIEPDLVRVEDATVSIRIWPLLRGQVEIPAITLAQPVVDLEIGADGARNWKFGADDETAKRQSGRTPIIGRIVVDEGQLSFHDPARDTDLKLEVRTLREPDEALPLRAGLAGRYKGLLVDARGAGGPVVALADGSEPYPLRVEFRVGPTHGKLDGTITGLVALAGADLRLEIAGESLSELFPVFRIALPPTPPYRLRSGIAHEPPAWQLDDFHGTVGDSDLSGSATITPHDKRVRLDARMQSETLDLDDLGGVIGAKPQTGAAETASPKQAAEAKAQAARPRILPDAPFRLHRLRAMDANVVYKAGGFRAQGRALQDLEVHVQLEDGILTLKPLNFGIADGNVVSNLVIDAREEQLAVDADIQIRRINLQKLLPASSTVARSTGLVGGRAVFAGTGNSFAQIVGSANGALGVASSGGRISNLLIELLGLDAAEALRFLFGGDKTVRLRCAVGDFELRDGVLHTRSAIVDTTDTNIHVDGTISLRDEELDLRLRPLPKDYSPLALRSPLHVRGRFKDPKIRLDDDMAVRGGLAAILGAVAGPLAALIPLIETGPGDNADCERLVEVVEKRLQTAAP